MLIEYKTHREKEPRAVEQYHSSMIHGKQMLVAQANCVQSKECRKKKQEYITSTHQLKGK